MSTTGSGGMGLSAQSRPHAYDPVKNPELFDGVLARRLVAFLIDLVVLSIPVLFAWLFFLFFGLITFGLGWILAFWILPPATVVWALLYYAMTLGGPQSATVGMRVMNLQMRTWYGAPAYFLLGAGHAVLFWILSPLLPWILLVGFFDERRRLLHDLLLGTVVINDTPGNPPVAA